MCTHIYLNINDTIIITDVKKSHEETPHCGSLIRLSKPVKSESMNTLHITIHIKSNGPFEG